MPNAVKYNVSAETLALKKGNFYIGTGTSHSCIESPNVEVNIIRID